MGGKRQSGPSGALQSPRKSYGRLAQPAWWNGRHKGLKILASALKYAYETRCCDEESVFRPDIGPELEIVEQRQMRA